MRLISSKITKSFWDLCQTQVWKEADIVEITIKLPEPSLLMEIRVFPSLYTGLAKNFFFCGNNCVTENPVLAKGTLLHSTYGSGELNRKFSFVKLN